MMPTAADNDTPSDNATSKAPTGQPGQPQHGIVAIGCQIAQARKVGQNDIEGFIVQQLGCRLAAVNHPDTGRLAQALG
ncbi:MAG: hypothetical protein MO852_03025 [Candidatus Devosia euplotis]|nr:hypothetical protein [Candidatus Devosia euplotis]